MNALRRSMMDAKLVLSCLVMLLLALSMIWSGPRFSETPAPPRAAGIIGAARVDLFAQDVGISPFVFRAFIPTGSTSTNCLATLSESNVATTGMNLFCGARSLNGVDGVLVAIFFQAPVGADALVGITVYQDLAKSYGTPVLFPD